MNKISWEKSCQNKEYKKKKSTKQSIIMLKQSKNKLAHYKLKKSD